LLQVHEKRFAVLTRFVDELEASLNPDEAIIGERSRPGNVADQSDRDSCDRSAMQCKITPLQTACGTR